MDHVRLILLMAQQVLYLLFHVLTGLIKMESKIIHYMVRKIAFSGVKFSFGNCDFGGVLIARNAKPRLKKLEMDIIEL